MVLPVAWRVEAAKRTYPLLCIDGLCASGIFKVPGSLKATGQLPWMWIAIEHEKH